MIKHIVFFGFLGLFVCSCGLYFRFPKKAQPDQSVLGERRELKTGGIRVHNEKDSISWRAPKGYHFEEIGTCVTKMRDAGKRSRVCTWKVVKDGKPQKRNKSK
jgi:hypothetical protein